jgi:WD40 repeat protein
VNAIRFLTDGTIVAVNDQACYRVDPNGEVRTAIHTAPNTPNLDQACGVAVSPDGKRFAVGRWNKSIHVHDVASGNEIWHEAITDGLSEIYAAFSPDGKMLAVTANGSKAHLFDASTGKSLGDLDSDQPKIWSLEFSPDGRLLTTHAGRTDNTLRVWDLSSRTVRLRINDLDFFPQSVAYSADGKFIAASGLDKKVKLIDTADGKIVRSCPNPSMPYRLVFSPDGKTLVCANSAGFISLMDVGTGEIQKSADPFDGVFTARFTADGKKLALASDRFSIRDWRSGAIEHRFEPLGEVPLHWDMSSDCKFAAYSDPDGGVHVGEIETGKERMKLAPTKSWQGLFFSTDGSRLFVADINGRIDVVDVSTGMILKTLDGQLRNNLLFRMASSADGRWLAAASAGTVGQRDFDIRIWDLNAGNEFRRISPKFGPVSEMEFSPDSSMLAAVGGPREPQASPGSIELFDPASGKEIRHFDGHTWYVLSVAFSPDGRTLATGSRDNTVRLWEVATGTERRRIEGHSFYVKSVAFSPDGIRLVSTSYDAPVYVWDVYSPPSQPSKPSVNEIWDALHSSSAHLGAVGEMISNPNLAFELCRGRIKPVITPEKKMVQKLADALGDADYRVRDNAESDLARLGDVIEPALRRELGASPSAEKSSRLNRLLSKLATPSGDQLAALRAMEAIERIGDSRARKLMEEWAGGDPDCSFTRAAKQSLGRMKTR